MVPLLYLALRCPTDCNDSRLRFAYRNRCAELLQSPDGKETFECMSYAYQILINSPLRDQYDEGDDRDSQAFLSDLVEQNGGIVEPMEYYMQQWGFLGVDRAEESFILSKFSAPHPWEQDVNLLPTADSGIFKRVFPNKHVPAKKTQLTKLLDSQFLSGILASTEAANSFFESAKEDFGAPFAAEFLYLLEQGLEVETHPVVQHRITLKKKHAIHEEDQYYKGAKRAEKADDWFLNTCPNRHVSNNTHVNILYYIVACELLAKLSVQWHSVLDSHSSQMSQLEHLLSEVRAKTNEWLLVDDNPLSETIAKTGENEYNMNFYFENAYNGFSYVNPAVMPLHMSLELSEKKVDRGNGLWTSQPFKKELEFPFNNNYYRMW